MALGVVLLGMGSLILGVYELGKTGGWSRLLWNQLALLLVVIGCTLIQTSGGSHRKGLVISLVDVVVFCAIGWYLAYCARQIAVGTKAQHELKKRRR